MAVIIGAGTQVNVDGVVSISWDYQPNIERLWELGSFSPFQTRLAPTWGFNMTRQLRRFRLTVRACYNTSSLRWV